MRQTYLDYDKTCELTVKRAYAFTLNKNKGGVSTEYFLFNFGFFWLLDEDLEY